MASDKKSLRTAMRQRLSSMSEVGRRAQSTEVCQQLLALEEIRTASVVLAFWPMASEPDISPALIGLKEGGATVLLPVVRTYALPGAGPGGPRLVFAPLEDPGSLKESKWGIMEPRSDPVDPTSAEVALIPALAVTPQGERLGHGYAYYDETLAALPEITTICPVFVEQILPSIPSEAHDQRVSVVVSAQGTIRNPTHA